MDISDRKAYHLMRRAKSIFTDAYYSQYSGWIYRIIKTHDGTKGLKILASNVRKEHLR